MTVVHNSMHTRAVLTGEHWFRFSFSFLCAFV